VSRRGVWIVDRLSDNPDWLRTRAAQVFFALVSAGGAVGSLTDNRVSGLILGIAVALWGAITVLEHALTESSVMTPKSATALVFVGVGAAIVAIVALLS
jgi:fumarate reductase subunit D